MTESEIKNAARIIAEMRNRREPKPYLTKDDRYSKRLEIDAIVAERRDAVKEVWE